MKYPALMMFSELAGRLDQFDQIIDVRSPAEFELDHIPGAINCPVLDNDERIRVGTMYKQVGSFEAKKVGAALVAKNIAHHIETKFIDQPRDWKPLIYCWRGGNRSGSMSLIFAKIGWPVAQLEGGYKAYRNHINDSMPEWVHRFSYQVICGTTGSGKSRLLQSLAKNGAQVLDLERLAAHRGSVLGQLSSQAQPSQKAFESAIWDTLRKFKPESVVFVESESKKVGNLRVPDALIEKIRQSNCIHLDTPEALRVGLLMQDYAHFLIDPDELMRRLSYLVALHGKEKIKHWHELISNGHMKTLVFELLRDHYDPTYHRSIARNFPQLKDASVVTMNGILIEDFAQAASQLKQMFP